MTGQLTGADLRAGRKRKGWSHTTLAAQLRRQAQAQGVALPKIESLVSLISRWENDHQTPDDFYRQLLGKVLDLPPQLLGIADAHQEAGESSALPVSDLVVDADCATLRYDDGSYGLSMSKRLINQSDTVVTRFLVRVAVDRFPSDPAASNVFYRTNPLTLEELQFEAWCGDEPMMWEVKHDRDACKELWLLFGNNEAKFPLYPGEANWIHYRYRVTDDKWGPWFQRAIRLPTCRVSVCLDFPKSIRTSVWGTETSLTMGQFPLMPPIQHRSEGERDLYEWVKEKPPLHARYRLEWKAR